MNDVLIETMKIKLMGIRDCINLVVERKKELEKQYLHEEFCECETILSILRNLEIEHLEYISSLEAEDKKQ